ncbi:glycosyltransferase family 4 protein [Kineosporia sp. J2-2]|uniref:Glycosyltransferase family 4 protein n=1 Tax=Kineosporia corallincola TaxID=2835133 RepID=A0ABS5TLR9_9ACTN|nr:glycosyltransferase family 4 protein [Kineosporia corallincola]MBT0772047.1 glycosyltransferase family 4 protein [Kineosporia corallincola]
MTEPAGLRLAVVSDAVYPWNKGGKEMRYHELLRRTAELGIHVDVYTMNWWRGDGPVVREGITYHAISPYVPLYAGDRRSIRQALVFSVMTLRMLFRRFDVLEADVIPFLQVFPLRLVATLRRKPYVVTWHEFWGRDYWVQYLGRKGYLAAFLEALAIRLPDRIVAASQGTAERIREAAGPRRPVNLTVVPNGIDPKEIAAAGPAREPVDLLFVGRLLRHKNGHLLLDAMARLREQGHDLTALVVGQGPEEERLRTQAAELGLSAKVGFPGSIPERADLLAALSSASVLAFPSVREGFGMVALEALACGCPVVTTDHPDNFARELIEPGVNGELCQATADSLAAALLRALEHRDRLGAAARRSAAAYEWDTLAAAVVEVYRA